MKYYIAPNFEAQSGIAHYSKNFFELILKDKGYKHIALSSNDEINSIIQNISNDDILHIEIGLGTLTERELLFKLLDLKDVIIDITLHDPTHLKYPYYEFKSVFLNKVSKFVQHYFNFFGFGREYYKKIRTIYVLNEKGAKKVKELYGANSKYMPHILPKLSIDLDKKFTNKLQLLYIGFIGKKKGLDYALELHKMLLNKGLDIELKIIGKPVDKSTLQYYEELQYKYSKKTNFLGYVSNYELKSNLVQNNIVILPTIDYKYICPTSGSVLNALQYGNVLLTTNANAITEIVKEGYNGFYLSNNLDNDVQMLQDLITNDSKLKEVSNNCIIYVNENHSDIIVNEYYESKK